MQVHPVIRQVENALQRAVPSSAKVILAVSGGADSIALASAAAALMEKNLCTAVVVHVEHGLRGAEALRDAAFVKNFCTAYKLPFLCEHVQARQFSQRQGLSVEDAARQLRYQVLYQCAEKLNADYILTAHHRDDQAETVLLKLLRGAGTVGLGGMKSRQGKILRPFLEISRSTLEEYCRLKGLDYCYDSSNSDLYYSRNRVRQELLPYLEKKFNPSIRQTLVQTAQILQEDGDYLEEVAAQQLKVLGCRTQQKWQIDVSDWQQLFPAVRKRLLRQAYFQLQGEALNFSLTESLDRLCLQSISGKKLCLPNNLEARYEYGKLYLGVKATAKAVTAFCQQLPLENGAVVTLQHQSFQVQFLHGVYPGLQLPNIIYPLDLLQGQVIYLRSRQPGDSFHPYGVSGGKKLKDYFIDKKIPRQMREQQVLVCVQQQVLGIFGLANAAWPQGSYNDWLIVKSI